jgi:ABC-type phosphate transport system substrate-binding protein
MYYRKRLNDSESLSDGHLGGSKNNQQWKRGQEMVNQLCKSKYVAALAASLLFLISQVATAGVVVIGNPDLSIKSVSAAEVSDIFLGKMTKLADGTPITVIEHQDGDSVKDEFYDKVVGKSPSQLKAYWAKIVFTGEGVPPKEYAGDKAVKDRVAVMPGAIGYVSDGSVDKSVKVLFEAK